uniref:Uncharacterized protein n=1 Tax=Sphaerodactylus townsendi TaxID=933632 RepID=A0ACB8FNA2_9SAUR
MFSSFLSAAVALGYLEALEKRDATEVVLVLSSIAFSRGFLMRNLRGSFMAFGDGVGVVELTAVISCGCCFSSQSRKMERGELIVLKVEIAFTGRHVDSDCTYHEPCLIPEPRLWPYCLNQRILIGASVLKSSSLFFFTPNYSL